MASPAEAATDAPTTVRNPGELLEAMKTGVAMLDLLGAAASFARTHKRSRDFAHRLNAFTQLVGAELPPGGIGGISWNTKVDADTVHSETRIEGILDELNSHATGLRDQVDLGWVEDVERDWKGRTFTIWGPHSTTLHLPRPSYLMIYNHGHTHMTVDRGTVFSGEVNAIDIAGQGAIGLRNGVYASFDVKPDLDEHKPEPPELIGSSGFSSLMISRIFHRSKNPEGGTDIWTPGIAIKEAGDYSKDPPVHPDF